MNEAIRFLDSLQGSGIRPGLDRVRKLLRASGRPERSCPTIIVAGTNGKGSTSATIASILAASGYRTGLYISPHLIDLRERWLIDGAPVAVDVFLGAIAELRQAITKAGFSPTYFEALTVLAFLIFRRTACEVVVLETGLGGRLDATNVTRPIAALITAIGIDHTEYLGPTLRSIAREKAGVIHRGAVVLTSNSEEPALGILRRRAAQFGALLHTVAGETRARRPRIEDWRLRFSLTTPERRYRIDSPLVGFHQIENVSLAVRAAELIAPRLERISASSIERGVKETRWRGRLERFEVGGKVVVVDGAHNGHAAARIAEFIDSFVPQPRLMVFGIMKDKDLEEVALTLFPRFDRIIITEPDPERTASTADLQRIATRMGLESRVVRDPRRAVMDALAGDRVWIVVCGSLYLAGAALGCLDALRADS